MSEQIFISYRRDGGDVTAKLICEALKNRDYTVFYDYDSISGGYFDSRILNAIETCDDFILVLPPNSLDRCVSEDDWVRQEIRHALRHKKNIIPVLLPGFEFPQSMPSDIAEITRFNGVQFVMAYFEGVILALIDRFTAKSMRKTAAQDNIPEPKPSAELAFELNKDGSGYTVKLGKCTDVSIVIPRLHNGKAVTAIGDSAFKGYTSLVSITIPNSVTSIGESAFSGCSLLENITIPNSVTGIGKWAFEDCSALTVVVIPKNVSSIGARAFLNCQALERIDVDEGNNFYCSCDGHLYTKNMKTFVSYAIGSDASSYVVADSVTRIEDSAFSRCTALTAVTIPGGVISIGDFAFYKCTSLARITLADRADGMASKNGDSYIGRSVFSGCDLLESFIIPSSVTSIGKWAFEDCSTLTSISIPKNVTNIGSRAFLNCKSLLSFDVDKDNSAYCSYDGHLYTKDMKTLVCYALGCSETDYFVPDGVVSIADSAFSRCTALMRVTIPKGVTSLGEFAFYRCTSITSITIPESLTSIADFAFKECASLKKITIPYGVTSIGEDTFRGCSSLVSVTIPNTVTSIEDSAFSGCSSLRSITLPNSLTSIGKWTFQDCAALTSITIPKNVTNISARVFLDCQSLASISVSFWNRTYRSRDGHLYSKNMKTLVDYAIGCKESSYVIPDGVTSIEDSAFSRCADLTSITIPGSVTSMGEFAFNRCSSLKNINYRGTVKMWKKCSIQSKCFNKISTAVIHCTDGDVSL